VREGETREAAAPPPLQIAPQFHWSGVDPVYHLLR